MSPRTLGRRPAFREQKPEIVIFCEGEKTEPAYLSAFCKDKRIGVTLKKAAGDPLSMVGDALKRRQELKKEAKRSGLEDNAQVWCVFDDDHRDTTGAFRAADGKVFIAFSNPCFEVWPILHLEPAYDRHKTNKETQDYLHTLMPTYDHKRGAVVDYGQIAPLYEIAQKAAIQQRARREAQNTSKGNPSTNMDELLDFLIAQKRS